MKCSVESMDRIQPQAERYRQKLIEFRLVSFQIQRGENQIQRGNRVGAAFGVRSFMCSSEIHGTCRRCGSSRDHSDDDARVDTLD